MMMASSDASQGTSGASGAGQLVPEANAPTESLSLEPVAGAQLAAPVAGQTNIIDPWIFQNFVQSPEGEFTVSPRNVPGDVLLQLELSPRLNPFLAHLSQMYNGWVGGMEVRIILAGNAFAAGKVIVCCVPPSFDASRLTLPMYTAFPHVIIDVRNLEPVDLPLEDVRNEFFHFNSGPAAPRMQMVVALYTPLRANSGADTEVFTIAGRVLTRPAANFSFTFLVPPTVERLTRPFTLPNVPVSFLTNSRWPSAISSLFIDPLGQQVVQFQNGRCTIDGQLQGTTSPCSAWVGTIYGTYIHNNEARGITLLEPDWDSFDRDTPAPLGFPDIRGGMYLQCTYTSASTGRDDGGWIGVNFVSSENLSPFLGTIKVTDHENLDPEPEDGDRISARVTALWDLNYPYEIPDYNGALDTAVVGLAPRASPPGFGEALVFFRSIVPRAGYQSNEIPCLLPQEWVQHFMQEQVPAQGDAALLHYRDPDTSRNLAEFKLYPQGFLTCSPGGNSPGALVLPLNGVFVFVSWVSAFYQLKPVGTARSGRRYAPAR
uniref:Capsid protein n=1 Tax=Norovirus GI TaxID=122928 RepID=A0A1S5QJB8_NORV|nr:capsid protein [Norovirus GI]